MGAHWCWPGGFCSAVSSSVTSAMRGRSGVWMHYAVKESGFAGGRDNHGWCLGSAACSKRHV